MKDLLQKLTDLENTLDSMDPTPKEVKQINEAASMSINMSGETADDVARLVQIMRDGGAPDAGEMKPDMMPPMGPPDMGKMRDLVKLAPPIDMDGMDGPPDMPSMGKMDKGDSKDKLMGMGEDTFDKVDRITDPVELNLNDPEEIEDAKSMSAEELKDELEGDIYHLMDKASDDFTDNDHIADEMGDHFASMHLNADDKTLSCYSAMRDLIDADPSDVYETGKKCLKILGAQEHQDQEQGNKGPKGRPAADAYAGGMKSEAGYDNSPEEDYKDHQYMTKDLSGGLNREKKAYAKAQDGDNAMAVECPTDENMAIEELQSALRDALMTKMAETEEVTESEDDFDESGCVGEMKKLNASGCTKTEMFKKVQDGYGCDKGKFEKLFAAHCG